MDYSQFTSFEYLDKIREILKEVEEKEKQNIINSVECLANVIYFNSSIYIFGASHAGILSQEAFYRAGGLANINPIFAPEVSVERSPITVTSKMERLEGYGTIIASTVDFKRGDALIVHSVSGRNPVTIEVAEQAKKKGVYVIGITNLKYSKQVKSRHSSGKKMYELCDYVIDNHGDIGDACISLEPYPQKASPTSTVVGATIMNILFSETLKALARNGHFTELPVFASANMDGGDEFNKEIFKTYENVIHYKH
ncbi:MAG: SIS domain-containing protein [Lachnospiraceae bacterium]|nr:SIS domain-containing protein [Lachnospiraceae bacterium]